MLEKKFSSPKTENGKNGKNMGWNVLTYSKKNQYLIHKSTFYFISQEKI
jgi:hypothetical protein